MLNEISFEAGSLETMIERLFKTMNSIDKQRSEKVEPASQKQIHALEEIADLKQHGKSIPYAYLLFLEEMGQNDNGLLEQEWDGCTEVNIESILRDYLRYIDEFDIDINMVMGYGVIFLLPCIIGAIAAMLFFMERDNDTFKNLRTIPVTSTQMIMAYPDEKTAFIGFFMTAASIQNTGIGSNIIDDLCRYLTDIGLLSVRLGWVKGNPQAEHFWHKNNFKETGITYDTDNYTVVVAQRVL